MRTALFIFFLLGYITITAQQRQIDSLETALKLHPHPDSVRLKLLSDLSYQYHVSNPDKGLEIANEALNLEKNIGNERCKGLAYYSRGINYWAKGEYNNAIADYQASQKIMEQKGMPKEIASLNNSVAIVYYNMSQFSKALEIYWKNLALYEKLHDTIRQASTQGNAALVYNRLGNYEKAITHYEKAITLLKLTKEKRNLADNYTNLGNTYDNMAMPAKAIEYYQQSLEISEQIQYEKNIASNKSNMGIALITRKDFISAYKYLSEAEPYYIKKGDTYNLAVVQHSIGDIYLNAPTIFFATMKIDPSKRYRTAQLYFDSSLKIYEELEDPASQAEVWEKLSLLYEKQNKFRLSLNAHKKYAVLKDSVLSDEKNEEIARLEMNYAFAKKEDSLKQENGRKITVASEEIKRQSAIKKSVIIGSSLLLLAVLASFFFYKKKRDAIEKQHEAEFNSKVTDTEMKALRLQMNPHFIFNSLNSIGDYIIKNNPGEADAYLSKFAKVMRMTLENSEKKEITLADDIVLLELYMQLEAKRLNDKFSYTISISPDVDPENILVPPMIFQPFVENSIWHGIAKKEGRGNIEINISRINGMLHCIIEDDGIGRQQPAATHSTTYANKESLGMKITKARIEILNKLKGSNATVQLIDKPQGLRAEVQLPSESKF